MYCERYEKLFDTWPYNLFSEAWGKSKFLVNCTPAYLEDVFADVFQHKEQERRVLEGLYIHEKRTIDIASWAGTQEGEVLTVHDRAIDRLRSYATTIREKPADDEYFVSGDEEEDMEDALKRNITSLDLSVRAYNCLYHAGIRSVGDLVGKTEEEVKGIRSLGKRSLEEIREVLFEHGLDFAVPEEE